MRIGNAAQSVNRNLYLARLMQASTIQKLATGTRITSAADDASGLAVAKKLGAQLTHDRTEAGNIQDTVNLYRVGESALGSAQDITGRMAELATQAQNGTLGAEERQMLQQEFGQLAGEIDRIGQNTTFNGIQVFDGEAAKGDAGNVSAGALSAASLGLDRADLTTADGAGAALKAIRDANKQLSTGRSAYGAAENALGHRYSNLTQGELDLEASLSRIMDTDYGKESINNGISMALNATSMALVKNSIHAMHQSAMYHLLW